MKQASILHSKLTSLMDSLQVQNRSSFGITLQGNVLHVRDGAIVSSVMVEPSSEIPSDAQSVAALERSPVSDGRKYDGAKEPLAQGFWQYFGKAAKGIALISKYGAEKYKVAYADQNWRKVDNAKGRYADALLRHLEAHLRGEVLDPESGKSHVDHMAWNALALSELEKQ